jgi:heat shock protein HslJ
MTKPAILVVTGASGAGKTPAVRRLEARGRPGVRCFYFDSIGVPSEEVTLVDSPLRNTYWKLVRLSKTPVPAAERQREPHLIFANNERRLSGSGGCNRVTGSFGVDGDKLRLLGMAGTMMACPTGMEQEQRFLRSVEKVERYRMRGSYLEMLDTAGAVIARFEAVALR